MKVRKYLTPLNFTEVTAYIMTLITGFIASTASTPRINRGILLILGLQLLAIGKITSLEKKLKKIN